MRLSSRLRRATTMAAVTGLATLGLVTFSSEAFAVHDLAMELDADTAVDGSALTPPTYDWESFFHADSGATPAGDIGPSGSLPSGFIARGQVADYALPEKSTYATGSKDTLNIGAIGSTHAGWQCGNSNNLGAKDDLVNVYAVAYRNPANSHLIVYFGAEKSSNLGDNNIGIWFLQGGVGCALPTSGRNTDFTGHHLPGDVLLTAAFTNGGETATVESHVWMGGSANGGEGSLGAAQSGFKCGGAETAAGAYACAITNDANNQPPNGAIDPPWNHPVKTPAAGTTDSLADQEFYEGGIDVTQAALNAGLAAEPCISTFVADTRSSQSPTATLFDYAIGSFPVCVPSTTMTNTAATASPSTVHAGDSITYTFYEKNDGRLPLSSPSVTTDGTGCATATSKRNTVNITGTTVDETLFNVGDTNFNNVLDPNEEWAFTCVSTSTTVHAVGHGFYNGNDVTYYTVGAADCTPGVVVSNKLCDLQERTSAGVSTIAPATTLREGTSAVVTFTYYETNSGDTPITNVSVSSTCSSPGNAAAKNNATNDPGTTRDETLFNVGDANFNSVLDVGETWQFTCTKTLTAGPTVASDTFSDSGTGHGTDSLGSAVPSTGESDGSSATITNNTPN